MGDSRLAFSEDQAARLRPYLPQSSCPHGDQPDLPFVTLTFATSLDSALSLAPGTRTVLSGPESKAMTHYLRSQHDAICIGVGTAIADDPGLNCRISGAGLTQQPRPIVVDPHARWDFSSSSKVMRLAREEKGLAPFILSITKPSADRRALLEELGGKYIIFEPRRLVGGRLMWEDILQAVRTEGLRSIMIEGGGEVINSLLTPNHTRLVDSVIVTIAPTWLGQGGVVVSPPRRLSPDGQPVAAARLSDICWIPQGEDVVLCGRFPKSI